MPFNDQSSDIILYCMNCEMANVGNINIHLHKHFVSKADTQRTVKVSERRSKRVDMPDYGKW